MYLSSSELQYIVELGGQQLLPVCLGAHNHTPISEHLQLLRNKAHAWFKFDTQPVQTVIVPEIFEDDRTFVSNGHLCLSYANGDQVVAKIYSILPEPSIQGINHEWQHPESLLSVPDAHINDVLIDPRQNLVAVAYTITGRSGGYIDLLALDGDGSHPHAVGPTLSTAPALSGCQNIIQTLESWRLDGLGKHIALWHFLLFESDSHKILWQLQIWDWQHSTTSNVSVPCQKRHGG
jgi:hypothetical protein